MQEYLITTKEVSYLSRDMSAHLDDDKINTYIRESEDIDIKPAVGDALFVDIKNDADKYNELLEGGTYKDKNNKLHVFAGLKRALAYYTYARLVKNSSNNVTRYGFVDKEGEYSNKVEYNQKLIAYNDAFSLADSYLKECVEYLNANKEKYPQYEGNGIVKTNRTRYRIIGD